MAYPFSDYASVRAALGVGIKELPDAVLEESLFHTQLRVDLKKLGADILTDYATALTAVGGEDFTDAFDIFSIYSFAYYSLPGLPQSSPRTISDGKALQTRHTSTPTAALISERLFAARLQLSEAYGDYLDTPVTASAPRTLFVASEPDVDPVTD